MPLPLEVGEDYTGCGGRAGPGTDLLSRRPSRWRGLCPWRFGRDAAGNVTRNERVVAAVIAVPASVGCTSL